MFAGLFLYSRQQDICSLTEHYRGMGMKHLSNYCVCWAWFLSSFLLSLPMSCAYTQAVTEPIGILVRTYQASGPLPFPIQPPPPIHQPYPLPNTPLQEVNYICAQWDPDEYASTAPFDTNYPTTEIILTKPQHFVRLLSGPQS